MIKILLSLFFLFSLLTENNLYSQTITPHALSNGGGYSSTMEWNMGESVSQRGQVGGDVYDVVFGELGDDRCHQRSHRAMPRAILHIGELPRHIAG